MNVSREERRFLQANTRTRTVLLRASCERTCPAVCLKCPSALCKRVRPLCAVWALLSRQHDRCQNRLKTGTGRTPQIDWELAHCSAPAVPGRVWLVRQPVRVHFPVPVSSLVIAAVPRNCLLCVLVSSQRPARATRHRANGNARARRRQHCRAQAT